MEDCHPVRLAARYPGGARRACCDYWRRVTKGKLAVYWQTVAPVALPGRAHLPLSTLRCLDGIGKKFFLKKFHGMMPLGICDGAASRQLNLAIEGVEGHTAMAPVEGVKGLVAIAHVSAIEIQS